MSRLHYVRQSCLQRHMQGEDHSFLACRFDLGKTYNMILNKELQMLPDQISPG